ncbi:MAG TPA: hypothetical protein VLX85_13895 [Stellaceae bacterium]|nr:hypothetical protein [Stellaceae bacterium]
MEAPIREMRLTMRVLRYWRDIAGKRPFPRVTDLDARELGEDWQNCLLIKLRSPLERSFLSYIGSGLVVPGGPTEGTALAECPPETILARATSYVSRVLAQRVPVSMGGSAAQQSGVVLYRSILAPLSEDGRTIDTVLGAANYREVQFTEEEHPV